MPSSAIQGEIAAAYVAGASRCETPVKVVALRSKAISAIAGTGGMVSIPLPVERVLALIDPLGGVQSISVAAQNGRLRPSSRACWELDELIAECERDDLPATRIPVDYASHRLRRGIAG